MPSARILIAEDEESLAQFIAEALRRQGYECFAVGDGDSALEAAADMRPDLIVLDIMLPRLDGFEVTRRLREDRRTRRIPIIMLTARRSEEDVVAGLEMGASDYLRKPFAIAELAARVKAQLRQSGGASVPGGGLGTISVGDLRIDAGAGEAYRGSDQPLDLSVTEYRLLEALASAEGRTVSREELLRRVWDMPAGDTRTLDVHVFRLRRKIEDDPENPKLLHTVRGRGYRLRHV